MVIDYKKQLQPLFKPNEGGCFVLPRRIRSVHVGMVCSLKFSGLCLLIENVFSVIYEYAVEEDAGKV